MPSITFPFDFRPSNTLVSTGNYTVPADTYAHVTATSAATDLVVNGTTVLQASFVIDDIGTASTNTTGITDVLTNGNSFPIIVSCSVRTSTGSATCSIQVDNNAGTETTVYPVTVIGSADDGFGVENIVLDPGSTIRIDVDGITGTLEAQAHAYNPQTINTMSFWAETGTTINGGIKIINEYDE